ncbi:hypothetical protein EVAR_74458_1 [Eumeta japonica]|uniref:Uncharacterized protein n=1 Tax=Eumeta variegata TaxID=151549 RepID=A0A4C1YP33_EUMVA|nr:hypothetical protein EVAR_74458_1 [Eumeta japonica]
MKVFEKVTPNGVTDVKGSSSTIHLTSVPTRPYPSMRTLDCSRSPNNVPGIYPPLSIPYSPRPPYFLGARTERSTLSLSRSKAVSGLRLLAVTTFRKLFNFPKSKLISGQVAGPTPHGSKETLSTDRRSAAGPFASPVLPASSLNRAPAGAEGAPDGYDLPRGRADGSPFAALRVTQ